MHRTAENWQDFQNLWDGPINFRINPAMLDFSFELPPLKDIVNEVRQDEHAIARHGRKGAVFNNQQLSIEAFRKIPIDELMTQPFALSHFKISRFDAPGKFLHGFGERVFRKWEKLLAEHDFTFERCYPIFFISGIGCATNYHMDFSHVLAWQIYGQKRFCGLRNPDQWADQAIRHNYHNFKPDKPKAIREEHSLCYDMRPGDLLWNTLLTPHWVEAGDEPAMSINISHGGLRYKGKLCPNEQQLEDFRNAQPDKAPKKMVATY